MRIWLFLLVAWLVFCAAAEAATPKAVIKGPRTARCGDKIVLDASDSAGETYEWDVTAVPPLDLDRDQPEIDGAELRLPSYPNTEYLITLVVAGIDEQGKPRADITRWRVKVEEHGQPVPGPPAPAPGPPAPAPGPAPVPPTPEPMPPQPGPPVPPLSEIAKEIMTAAQIVQSPQRVTEAHALGDVFEALAAKIMAGAADLDFSTEERARGTLIRIAQQLAADIKRVTGPNLAAWQRDFDPKFQAQFARLFTAGVLRDQAGFVQYLRDVAQGLKAVR